MATARGLLPLVVALANVAAFAEEPKPATSYFDPGLDLRYRYEGVEQDGFTNDADANTVRIRANLALREYHGFSGLLEVDHIEAIGSQDYNDTRNGNTEFPSVNDPEGTGLNQLWLQYEMAT